MTSNASLPLPPSSDHCAGVTDSALLSQQFIESGCVTHRDAVHNKENSVHRLMQALLHDKRKNCATEILTASAYSGFAQPVWLTTSCSFPAAGRACTDTGAKLRACEFARSRRDFTPDPAAARLRSSAVDRRRRVRSASRKTVTCYNDMDAYRSVTRTSAEPLCKEFFFSRVTIFKVLTGAPACAAASTALCVEAKSIDRDLGRDTPSQ